MDVQSIYTRRFSPDLQFRQQMWRVLCRDFFQKYVPRDGHVLEIGAGYCEFINNIEARHKVAVDINPDLPQRAAAGVETIVESSTHIPGVQDSSIDLAFASNFFEHLTRDQIVQTLHEVRRVLKRGGHFMVLQPNIRYCGRDYWMFFDHITPIDDRAFVEVLELNGLRPTKVISRFLPYTTQSRLPRSLALIQLYLRVPLAWRFLGGQAFILSCKPL